jgi:hypothetical protein
MSSEAWLQKAMALLCGAIFTGVGVTGEALAADKKQDRAPKKSEPVATAACCPTGVVSQGDGAGPSEKITLTTGTHFKEKTRKRGEITLGRNSVVVLDQQAMQRSGAATLREVLARHSTTW